MSEAQVSAALSLLKRLWPSKETLGLIIDLVPDVSEKLLTQIEQPLQVQVDATGKEFILCEYARDGDSFRSPWTNQYNPPLEDGTFPSERLRAMEITANEMFSAYREQYYDGGLSSVYMWDLENGFAGSILFHKAMESDVDSVAKTKWDAVHVVEVIAGARTYRYRLSSSVRISLTSQPLSPDQQDTQTSGELSTSAAGTLTHQEEHEAAASDSTDHIANIGQLIERVESKIMHDLNGIHFGKLLQIQKLVHPGQGGWKNVGSERRHVSAVSETKSLFAAELNSRLHGLRHIEME